VVLFFVESEFGPVPSGLRLSNGISCVDVPIAIDGVLEDNEQFTLRLWSDEPRILITFGQAIVTIIDNDSRSFSIVQYSFSVVCVFQYSTVHYITMLYMYISV